MIKATLEYLVIIVLALITSIIIFYPIMLIYGIETKDLLWSIKDLIWKAIELIQFILPI